ncbi:hypothetical protein BDW69DRAFT_59340 [Aspergillus filifer]
MSRSCVGEPVAPVGLCLGIFECYGAAVDVGAVGAILVVLLEIATAKLFGHELWSRRGWEATRLASWEGDRGVFEVFVVCVVLEFATVSTWGDEVQCGGEMCCRLEEMANGVW